MNLPDGLSARPLTMADAPAVAAVMAAQQLADIGAVFVQEADIVGDWQRPSADLAAATIGVFDGSLLVGYAEVADREHADAGVLPAYRGRGIGTQLAWWMQERARTMGASSVGMAAPVGSPGAALMTALGYRVSWTSWVLQLPPDRDVAPQPLPPGYLIREAVAADYPTVHRVIEDAFAEWSAAESESFADFAADAFQRPGFEAWQVRVAVDADGDLAGAALLTLDEGRSFVSKLGVRADQRRRGLARALLADAFGRAREHGASICELATDARTGALGLYEKVGMVVTSTWQQFAIDV